MQTRHQNQATIYANPPWEKQASAYSAYGLFGKGEELTFAHLPFEAENVCFTSIVLGFCTRRSPKNLTTLSKLEGSKSTLNGDIDFVCNMPHSAPPQYRPLSKDLSTTTVQQETPQYNPNKVVSTSQDSCEICFSAFQEKTADIDMSRHARTS